MNPSIIWVIFRQNNHSIVIKAFIPFSYEDKKHHIYIKHYITIEKAPYLHNYLHKT